MSDVKPSPEITCRSLRTGELRLGVAGRGELRWAAVDISGPLDEARARLDLSPIAAIALGRAAAAAALLLRFTVKTPGRLLLEVNGNGPLGRVSVEVDDRGFFRGLVGEPHVETPDDGHLSIGWAVGQGTLKVTRVTDRGRYDSQVELVSGEIGKDLVHFLEQSQQIRSAALLGVLPRTDGIAEAGGILIEAFPGIAEETLAHLERNISRLDGVSSHLDEGGLTGLLDALLSGLDRERLETHEMLHGCGQGRDNIRRKLAHLGDEDLDSIVDSEGKFVVDCAYCRRAYVFHRDELALETPQSRVRPGRPMIN